MFSINVFFSQIQYNPFGQVSLHPVLRFSTTLPETKEARIFGLHMLLPNKNVDYFLITPENPVVFKIFDYFVTHVWCHSDLWPLSNGLLTIVRNRIFEAQHPRGWKVQNQHLCDKNKWLSHFRTFSFLLFLSLKVLKILCRGTNLFPNRAILPERTQKRLNQQKSRSVFKLLWLVAQCSLHAHWRILGIRPHCVVLADEQKKDQGIQWNLVWSTRLQRH